MEALPLVNYRREVEIDLLGPEPLKEQIAEILAGRITDGTYPPRRAIPSGAALCAEFGVSRKTIGEAVRILKVRGLVIGSPGKGVFVNAKPPASKETGG